MERRKFLKASSVTAGLAAGFFRNLSARAAGDLAAPTRLIILTKPNGSSQKTGNFRLADGRVTIPSGSALAPLVPFQNRMSVISGMSYTGMPDAAFGCHLADPFVLSSGFAKVARGRWDGTDNSYDYSANAATVDRFIAGQLPKVPLESIMVHDRPLTGDDVRDVSFDGAPVAGTPRPASSVDSPGRLWDRLFAGRMVSTDPQAMVARARRAQVATGLQKAYDTYRSRLAGWERAEVENHLDAIEKLRTSALAAPAGPSSCMNPTRPGETDATSIAGFDAVANLLVAAMKCDITRVATFSFWDGTWSVNAGQTGAASRGGPLDGHGDIGHGGDGGEGVRRCVDQWHVERFASLLRKLDAVPENNGTMLDNSIVVFANRDPDHDGHWITDLTWLVAGGGGGRLAQGSAFRWPSGQASRQMPHTRLLATLCRGMGVDPRPFTTEQPLAAMLR